MKRLACLALLSAFGAAARLEAALCTPPTFLAAQTWNTPYASTYTTPFTVPAGGDLLLLVRVYFDTAPALTSLTYGGQALQLAPGASYNTPGGAGQASVMQTWILVNPPSG